MPSRPTILLADDELSHGRLMEILLAEDGYKTVQRVAVPEKLVGA